MKEKEYPMPDDYKQYVAQLLDFIEMRDEFLVTMKDMTPEEIREVQEPLKVLNENIEGLERDLADRYEAYQKERRVEEEQIRIINIGLRKLQELYILIKHLKPEELEEFTKTLEPFSSEERKEFFDGVAILEAQNLDEILAGKNLDNGSISE